MSIVIVALPREDDRVWKLSSEKVPHLTLMFLGDTVEAEQLSRIVLFVEHLASLTLHRFGLEVDRRGELGEESADVLFFKKSANTFKTLKEVLAYLLANRDVYEAYSSATQFPEWIPHLTLGFPSSPARDDNLDYGINWVEFDRLAVWTGDYDGPEFALKDYEMTDDIYWADQEKTILVGAEAMGRAAEKEGGSYLSQFGIKGQRWGIRRSKIELARESANADPDAVQAVKTQAKIKSSGSLNVVSSKDLQQLVKRIELEQKYVSLTVNNPQAKKGESLLKKVLAKEANTFMNTGDFGPGVRAIRRALGSKGNTPVKTKPAKTKPVKTIPFHMVSNPAARRTKRAQQVYNVTTMGAANTPMSSVPSRRL